MVYNIYVLKMKEVGKKLAELFISENLMFDTMKIVGERER